jgi:hypothetical protein
MEKEKPGDPDFEVPERLKELYAQKDFGKYADRTEKCRFVLLPTTISQAATAAAR